MIGYWKRWLLAIWIVWLTLAYIFAWQRSTCGLPWETACLARGLEAFGNVVLLTWVSKYQELIAGLAALAGGACVVWAYKLQSNDLMAQKNAEAREGGVALCSIASQRFIDLGYKIATDRENDLASDAELISSNFIRLAYIEPMLATVTMAALRNAKMPRSKLDPGGEGLARKAAAECYTIARILQFVGDNLDLEGRFPFKKASKIPPGSLRSTLQTIGASQIHIPELRHFFDWENYDSG